MKITLVSVFVKDPIEAHHFYTEILGFRTQRFMPENNLAIVVSPEQPEGTALLLEPNDNPIAGSYQQALYAQGMPAIVFGVADIQQEFNRLKQLGVVFRQEPARQDWGGYTALFEDTCGNLIQLAQPLE